MYDRALASYVNEWAEIRKVSLSHNFILKKTFRDKSNFTCMFCHAKSLNNNLKITKKYLTITEELNKKSAKANE